MSRDLTAGMTSALTATTVRPALLFEGQFVATTVRYWTGIGTLAWDGHNWLGIGDLIEVAAVDESDDLAANGVAIKLSGATSDAIEEAFDDMRNGTTGIIRLALLDDTGSVIADPAVLFRGRLDVPEIDDSDPGKPLITISYESELIDLERPRLRQFTNQDQMALYPGDTGLRYVAALQDYEVKFGMR